MLAAQFESFRDPLIILITVPLSMTGALGALWLAGGTLNVFSQIGLVTLVGLITKHGILIVEFANQLQEEGRSRVDAAIEAAGLRLRPILMTTGAMVLGALPLAIASGAGAESRQQIGWVIVGGMSFGTLLTLFVIPTVYSFLGQVHGAKDATEAAAPGTRGMTRRRKPALGSFRQRSIPSVMVGLVQTIQPSAGSGCRRWIPAQVRDDNDDVDQRVQSQSERATPPAAHRACLRARGHGVRRCRRRGFRRSRSGERSCGRQTVVTSSSRRSQLPETSISSNATPFLASRRLAIRQ